jgi:hypothetical protein
LRIIHFGQHYPSALSKQVQLVQDQGKERFRLRGIKSIQEDIVATS